MTNLARIPFTSRLASSVFLFCIVALGGCASPQVVRWSVDVKAPRPAPTNLDPGRAYADAARKAYQDAVSSQVEAQSSLSNGLLGLGALATGLAVSNAHRDALLGTAFIGGTAYAFGNMNLSKQRIVIYQRGVEAIDCANRAIAPLAIDAKDQADLDDGLRELNSNIQLVNDARATLDRAKSGFPVACDKLRAAADAAQVSALAAIEAARRSQIAGQKLSAKVRGASEQLIQTVNKIDAVVVRAVLETIPDLTSIPKVVAGLSGYAASFAPGAGVDTWMTSALTKRAEAIGSASKAFQSLEQQSPTVPFKATVPACNQDSTKTLIAAVDRLLATASRVQSHLSAHEAALGADQLADCGVTDVGFPLRASSERVIFPAGVDASKVVVLSGGTKPYVVELADTPVSGVSIKGPAPFESRLQITVAAAAKAPQTLTVLIMDSSNPTKVLEIPIQLGEAK